ncbi:MAG TPA: zinc-ribbon domain-containing protein, partial [Kofleriaceae bacterium]|nr:zinc-ribbon domain-containing protein [Kofleriaceae bacterium]
MKNCPKCGTQLPSEAPFCGACGTRQPAAAAPPAQVPGPGLAPAASGASTQMGYSAGQLIDHMRQQGVSAPLPLNSDPRAPTMIAPDLASASTMAAPGPSPFAAPSPAASPVAHFSQTASPAPVHLPPFGAPPPAFAPPAPPAAAPAFAPSPAFAPPAASAFAPAAPASAPAAFVMPSAAPPPAFGGPPVAQPPSAFVPASAPAAKTQIAPQTPGAPMVAQTLPDPMLSPFAGAKPAQARVDPTGSIPLADDQFKPAVFQPSKPPAAAQPMRLTTTADPFASSLKIVMLVFGVLCLAMFVTPRRADPLAFTFDNISGGEVSALVVMLL